MNKSEVARLIEEIESTCTAMREGLSGYAQGARHLFITAKTKRLGEYQEQLALYIGEDLAIDCMSAAYERCIP